MNKDQRIDESFVLCRLQLELYICLVLIGFKISRDMNRQRVGCGGVGNLSSYFNCSFLGISFLPEH